MDKPLHQRMADMEEELAYLRSEVGLSIRSTQIRVLKDLGMGSHHARVILALRAARGRTLSVFQVAEAADLTPGSAKTVVCAAKRWLPMIKNQRGAGYYLTKEGQEWVDETLRNDSAPCAEPATSARRL